MGQAGRSGASLTMLAVIACVVAAANAPSVMAACSLQGPNGPCQGYCGGDDDTFGTYQTCVFVNGQCECADGGCAYDEYYQKCAGNVCKGDKSCYEFGVEQCGCRACGYDYVSDSCQGGCGGDDDFMPTNDDQSYTVCRFTSDTTCSCAPGKCYLNPRTQKCEGTCGNCVFSGGSCSCEENDDNLRGRA